MSRGLRLLDCRQNVLVVVVLLPISPIKHNEAGPLNYSGPRLVSVMLVIVLWLRRVYYTATNPL